MRADSKAWDALHPDVRDDVKATSPPADTRPAPPDPVVPTATGKHTVTATPGRSRALDGWQLACELKQSRYCMPAALVLANATLKNIAHS